MAVKILPRNLVVIDQLREGKTAAHLPKKPQTNGKAVADLLEKSDFRSCPQEVSCLELEPAEHER